LEIDSRTLAWILYAVAMASGNAPASRTDISNAADAINHAVPTHAELDGALKRLLACGLVETHGRLHALSPTGQALLGEVQSTHHTVTAAWRALTEELAASRTSS
jgi:hypothetical protein